MPQLLHLVVKNSSYFRWQLVRTAKKFGALRKEAEKGTLNMSRFMDAFEDTSLAKEAVERTLWELMDTEGASKVLKGIQDGDIELKITKLTPIGLSYSERGGQLVVPRIPDAMTLGALKRRLDNEKVVLHCLYCKNRRRLSVKSVPKKVQCPKCGGVLIAAIPQRMARDKLDEGKRERSKLYKNANLVMAYGKKAVITLMARGIGPDIAARILRHLHENEEEFLRDLLKAEVSYARTRRFWD